VDVRTRNVLRFRGLGQVLALLIVLTLLVAVVARRAPAPPSFAAAVEVSPNSMAPGTEPVLDVLPEAIPALSPVLLKPAIQVYRGREFRLVKTLTLRVTAYASDPRCTYPYDGKTTASGLPVTTNGGHLVAADTDLIPMHSLVIVPGYAQGRPVPVLDRGSAIKGHRLDVLLPTFNQAKSWGVRTLHVEIYQPLN
jgi:3D (Asp-Asp-Asp) domain-containing protein